VDSGGCFLQRGVSWQLLQRGSGSHALGGEHPAALKLPVLVLLLQHGAHLGVDLLAGEGGPAPEWIRVDHAAGRSRLSLRGANRLVRGQAPVGFCDAAAWPH